MSRRVLITGGAGFIGSYLAEELLAHDYEVRVLDSLAPHVHGPGRVRPSSLVPEVVLMEGDLRDPLVVRRALDKIDVVIHLAARVGVGSSKYELAEYTSVNHLGTAVLLDALAHKPVERLVVASSVAVYGEGRYRSEKGEVFDHVQRTEEQLARGEWDPRAPDGRPLVPVPTPESKAPTLASLYALSKYDQERMCLMVGATHEIPTVALRLFDVYGPRQALSNPYTGFLAVFAARIVRNRSPLLFEDGRQRRDLVHVRDVATAFRLACEADVGDGGVFNIGSGIAVSMRQIAERMASAFERELPAEVTGQYRTGDVRQCTADINLARLVLGYRPKVTFDHGIAEVVKWITTRRATDRHKVLRAAFASRGLAL